MKIIVCPDSFKGTMTAPQAARAIADGIRSAAACRSLPSSGGGIVLLPVGDGGEGTVDALCAALPDIETVSCATMDPLRRHIVARYAVSEGKTALIESAAASGLTLVGKAERNIMVSDTYGTGLLIADAFRRGIRDFIICMGGTATCDGGYGAFEAMKGTPGLREAKFTLLCDVDNPLCGPAGAAAVFGPQKGAAPEQIPVLDRRLRQLALLYGLPAESLEYAGAAGGLAGMLMACYGATPVSGIAKVLEILGFEKHLEEADLVITGEGRADATTLSGKAAKGILDIAGRHGVPVALVAGCVRDIELLREAGFSYVAQATPSNPDPLISPAEYLKTATAEMLRNLESYNDGPGRAG